MFNDSLLLIHFILFLLHAFLSRFFFYSRFSKIVYAILIFFFIFSYLFDYSRLSTLLSHRISPPSHFPDSHSLARPAVSFCVYVFFFARSCLPYSRFISFFRHPSLRWARTHVLPASLSLSPSFSHRSLSLRRRMSPTFESIARFACAASLLHPSAIRKPTLPLPPSISPPLHFSLSFLYYLVHLLLLLLLNLLHYPLLLFPQISSTIFAISITRAHLFLL